jgi:hypothetical protein
VEELELVGVCCGWRTPDAVDAVVCAPDDGWKYHPKHVEQFPNINKLCNVASCWIYIGILLAHPILHISGIRVKDMLEMFSFGLHIYFRPNELVRLMPKFS